MGADILNVSGFRFRFQVSGFGCRVQAQSQLSDTSCNHGGFPSLNSHSFCNRLMLFQVPDELLIKPTVIVKHLGRGLVAGCRSWGDMVSNRCTNLFFFLVWSVFAPNPHLCAVVHMDVHLVAKLPPETAIAVDTIPVADRES